MERTKSGHIFSIYTGKKITNRTYAPSHVWRATPKKEIDFASFFVCVLHWLGQYPLFPVFFEEGRVRKADSKRSNVFKRHCLLHLSTGIWFDKQGHLQIEQLPEATMRCTSCCVAWVVFSNGWILAGSVLWVLLRNVEDKSIPNLRSSRFRCSLLVPDGTWHPSKERLLG